MKRSLKHALGAAALTGGFLLLGSQAAFAGDGIDADVDTEVASGNVSPAVQVTVCGNSVAVLDTAAEAECGGNQSSASDGSAPSGSDAGRTDSDVDTDVTSGNVAPAVQTTVCGNSVAVLDATSDASCGGNQRSNTNGTVRTGNDAGRTDSDVDTDVTSGNVAPAVTVAVCGNSVAVADASSSAGCHGEAATRSDGEARGDLGHAGGTGMDTVVASGNVAPAVQATVCGNSVGALGGSAEASCGAPGTGGDSPPQTPGGDPGDAEGPPSSPNVQDGAEEEVAGVARRAPTAPLGEVLGRHLVRGARGGATLTAREASAVLPITGAWLRPHLAWASVFFLCGAGLLARDALTR